MAINQITKNEFRQRIWDFEASPSKWSFAGSRPAVVYFFAPWCGPCRKMTPILEKMSVEYDNRVDFYKVNTDDEKEIISALCIRTVPTLLLCPQKGEPSTKPGLVYPDDLRVAIEGIL